MPYVELLTFSPCREGNPAAVPGNSPVKVTLIIYWRSAKSGREPARVFFCVRERAFVCLLEEPLNGGGRSFTNIGFTHWKQPPVNLLPSPPPPTHTHTGSSPADTAADTFLCSVRKPTRSFGYFFMDFNA